MTQGLDELVRGSVLKNRYEILGVVGGGGMGTVYEAVDKTIADRPKVAIKEMKQKGLNPAELAQAKKRFRRETDMLSALDHPNLPYVYDAFEERSRYYLVMEFIEGKTLLQSIQSMHGSLLDTPLILNYALQLCDVLSYLHKQREPIIFRDLKPSNVIIRPDGRVFLIDFGIARVFKDGQRNDTEAFGTKGYVAPEVGVHQTDARTDLYSLGAMLHYCLTGQEPQYYNGQFPPIHSYNYQVPANLDELVQRMVQYYPQDRPQSVDEAQRKLGLIKQQLEQTTGQFNSAANSTTPSSPSDPTVRNDDLHSAPTVHVGAMTQFLEHYVRPFNKQVQSTVIPRLTTLFTDAKRRTLYFAVHILLPFLVGIAANITHAAQKAFEYSTSPEFQKKLSNLSQEGRDAYLHINAKLKATGVWTPRFLLLLAAILSGTALLSSFIYTTTSSYYLSELVLVLSLLVSIIVVSRRLYHPVPRNILLCMGIFSAISLLVLMVSRTVNGTQQALTLNQVFTYGLAILCLLALIGKIDAYQNARSMDWFTKLSHFGLAGVAGLCFWLQYSLGLRERLPFLPAALHPSTIQLLGPITLNNVFLFALAGIAVFSLLRLPYQFNRVDYVALLPLSLIYIPLQYSFGPAEIAHVLVKADAATLIGFNLLLLACVLILAIIAVFPLPRQIEWIGQVLLCLLAVLIGGLQNFSSVNTGRTSLSNLSHLPAFGQILFYSMGIAVIILLFCMFKKYNVADHIALFVVTLGCGLVQWSVWQAELHNVQALSDPNMLYAPMGWRAVGYALIVLGVLALGIATANRLFHLASQYSWLEQAEHTLNRMIVLGVVLVSFSLLQFFGDQNLLLATSFNIPSTLPTALDGVLTYNLIIKILLGFIGVIALFRLKQPFGGVERVAMLLSGLAAMLVLASGNALMPQVTGNVFSVLTIDRMLVTTVLITSLISLFWLTRKTITVDRIVLGTTFGGAVLCTLVQQTYIQHVLLLTALILLIEGTVMAAQIERVRRGNRP